MTAGRTRGLTGAARPAARRLRVIARLAREERADRAGVVHPSMWRRGFFSHRLLSYPGVSDPSLPYITDVRFQLYSRTLNSPSARILVHDKNVFADALAARGLGHVAPVAYGLITHEGIRFRSPAAREAFHAQPAVVVKPAARGGGVGVRIVPPAEAAAMVARAGADLLVQELIHQHPDLADINPGSLNTVRLLAVRVADDECVLAAAAHRWGTVATEPVDNVSRGGLTSSVDLQTGRLGPAVGLPREGRRIQVDRHPDTGRQITGQLVPQWAKVRELGLRLMAAFPELDHVGWDLAVSDRGPLVVEGNGYMPAPAIFQFHGPFVHDPRLRAYYVRHKLLPAG
jgi:hypothetical protein